MYSPSFPPVTKKIKKAVKRQMKKADAEKTIGIKDFKKMNVAQKLSYTWTNHRKQVISLGVKVVLILILLLILWLNEGLKINGIMINGSADSSQRVINEFNADISEWMKEETFKIQIELIADVDY